MPQVREDAAAEVEKLGPALIYPHASDAHAKTTDDALAGAKSTYDWLRLYFEEVGVSDMAYMLWLTC